MVHAAAAGLVLAVMMAPAAPRRVIWVVVDGVRQNEWAGGAVDDDGGRVPPEKVFPGLKRLAAMGVEVPHMRVSNPAAVSLPAYADMFSGTRQKSFVDNSTAGAHNGSVTVFERVQQALRLAKQDVAVHSSWQPLCNLAVSNPAHMKLMELDCGFPGARPALDRLRPEIYAGSRADVDTWVGVRMMMQRHPPRLLFVHMGDADEEAHLQAQAVERGAGPASILPYHQALQRTDGYITRLWDMVSVDKRYAGNTYLLVTTDHGRGGPDMPHSWTDHGECVKAGKPMCSGCAAAFAVAVGPGLKAGTRVDGPTSHTQLAATVARWLGVKPAAPMGPPVKELLPKASR